MCSIRSRLAMTLGLLGVTALAGALVGVPAGSAQKIVQRYSAPLPQVVEPAAPIVVDTPTNLQTAFTREMNAKQRYVAFAQCADREGYPAVARLFRACAQAEQVHANEHVHAIAWNGREAKAMLERLGVGTTAENLRTAIDSETYEVTTFYPALLERARSDRQPMAVRSMTFALSAEREHVALLTAALASLDQRPPAPRIYVCPLCGKTVESLDFRKCPNCFTAAKRFIRET
jgi:rubrerythrin